MLNNFDDYLIDTKFQPFAHWFQKITGKTSFWLAKWMHVAVCITAVVLSVIWIILLGVIGFIASLFFLILIPSHIEWIKVLEKEENEFMKNYSCAMNKLRIIDRNLRTMLMSFMELSVVCLVFFVILIDDTPPKIAFASYVVFQLFTVVAVYFSACTPLPPGESKIKEWCKRTFNKIDEKLFPKPGPVGPTFWQ